MNELVRDVLFAMFLLMFFVCVRRVFLRATQICFCSQAGCINKKNEKNDTLFREFKSFLIKTLYNYLKKLCALNFFLVILALSYPGACTNNWNIKISNDCMRKTNSGRNDQSRYNPCLEFIIGRMSGLNAVWFFCVGFVFSYKFLIYFRLFGASSTGSLEETLIYAKNVVHR